MTTLSVARIRAIGVKAVLVLGVAAGLATALPNDAQALPGSDTLICTFTAGGAYDGQNYNLGAIAGPVPGQCLHIDFDGIAQWDADGTNDTALVPISITGTGVFAGPLCTGETQLEMNFSTPADGEIASLSGAYRGLLLGGFGPMTGLGATFVPQVGNPNPTRPAVVAGDARFEFGPACGSSGVKATGTLTATNTA